MLILLRRKNKHYKKQISYMKALPIFLSGLGILEPNTRSIKQKKKHINICSASDPFQIRRTSSKIHSILHVVDEGVKEQKAHHFGITEMGGGMAQISHFFCPTGLEIKKIIKSPFGD